jgi:hypothetical protein
MVRKKHVVFTRLLSSRFMAVSSYTGSLTGEVPDERSMMKNYFWLMEFL